MFSNEKKKKHQQIIIILLSIYLFPKIYISNNLLFAKILLSIVDLLFFK